MAQGFPAESVTWCGNDTMFPPAVRITRPKTFRCPEPMSGNASEATRKARQTTRWCRGMVKLPWIARRTTSLDARRGCGFHGIVMRQRDDRCTARESFPLYAAIGSDLTD